MFNIGGLFKGIAGFINASNERRHRKQMYEAEKKWVAYNNTMRALQAAQDNNVITQNIAAEKAAAVEEQIMIEGNAMKAKAAAEVAAATVGAAGGSVEATLFNIGRNEAKRSHQAYSHNEASINAMEHQRHKIAINLAVGKQFVGPKPALGPSPALALFGGFAGALAQNPNARRSSGTTGLL